MEIVNNEKLVSVIIPAYNAEKYLKDAVYSLTKIKYDYMEIIIINDGSTDGTKELIEILAKEDKRVKGINTRNGGVSKARNKGIDMAKGEYLFFLDADDTVETNNFENMLKMLKSSQKVDMLIFPYNIVDEKLNFIRKVAPYKNGNVSVVDFKKTIITSTYMNFCWGKLIRRKFLENNQIYFKDGKKIGEDVEFQLQIMNKRPHMKYKDEVLVNYRQQKQSVMHQFKQEYFDELEKDFSMRLALSKSVKIDKQDVDLMYKDIAGVFVSYIRKLSKENTVLKNVSILKDDIMKRENFKFLIDNTNTKLLTFPQKISIFLLKMKMYFCLIMVLRIS